MKRESKVISLELAKQIHAEHKRLGIEVESEWWWVLTRQDEEADLCDMRRIRLYKGDFYDVIPAYDTSELGEMLPNYIEINGVMSFPGYGYYINGDKIARYLADGKTKILFSGDTEAEARGKLYLWLLEEGYIKEVER